MITTPDDIRRAIEDMGALGPVEWFRAHERQAGNVLVPVGSVPWLAAADWPDSIVVSRRGNIVRLVALRARHPGTGAFSRTVTGIARAGLVPFVVEPMGVMEGILRRWRWKRRVRGHGFEREAVWYPHYAWLIERRGAP